jgi:hypothetical protein
MQCEELVERREFNREWVEVLSFIGSVAVVKGGVRAKPD